MSSAPEPQPSAGGRAFAWLLVLVAVPVALWFVLRPAPASESVVPGPTGEPPSNVATAALSAQPGMLRLPLVVLLPDAAPMPMGSAAAPVTALASADAGADVVRAAPRFEPEISLLVSVAQDLRHPGTQRASDAVQAQFEGLRSCYRESFAQGAALVGGLSARLHVEPAGPVSEALVRGALGGPRGDGGVDTEVALRSCVERVLRTVHIPDLAVPPQAGADASVYAGSPTWADAGSHETGTDVFVRLIFTRRLAAP